MSNCLGITHVREKCNRIMKKDDESLFCHLHKYQENIPKSEMKKILNNDPLSEYKVCNRCLQWHNKSDTTTCEKCLLQSRKYNAEKKVSCCGTRKDDKPCENRAINDTQYCKDHDYMVNYTEHELDNLKKCNSCKRKVYWEGEFKTCERCRNYGKINRINAQQNDTRKWCKNHDGSENECKNHASEELNNGFCKKCDDSNNVEIKKNKIIESGGKVCNRWHHSKYCLEALDINDPNNACEKCRGAENDRENKNREIKKNIAENFNNKHQKNDLDEILNTKKELINQHKYQNRINEVNEKSEKIFKKKVIVKEPEELEKLHEEKCEKLCAKLDNNNVNLMCISCNNVCDFAINFIDENGNRTKNCLECRNLNKKLDELYRKAEKKISSSNNNKIKKLNNVNKEFASILYKIYKLNAMEKLGLEEYRKKKCRSFRNI